MTSKARLPQEVAVDLQAMVEVQPMEMEVVDHLAEAVEVSLVAVLLVEVEVHQQEGQGPPSRPAEEEDHQGVVIVALLGVVMVGLLGVVQWDQTPLRRMPRWSRTSVRKLVTTGPMLLRNIQV